jgi:hypothetical protein
MFLNDQLTVTNKGPDFQQSKSLPVDPGQQLPTTYVLVLMNLVLKQQNPNFILDGWSKSEFNLRT